MSEKKGCCDSCCGFLTERLGEGGRVTLVLGCTIGLSLCLAIVGCIIENYWLMMVMMVPIMLVPIFVIIFNWVQPPSLENASPAEINAANFGACFLGVIFSVLFGLPIVLLHTDKSVTVLYFVFWMIATLTGIGGLGYYVSQVGKVDRD